MAQLELIEDGEKLTYIGLEDLSGFSLVVMKDTDNLDVRQISPTSICGDTWQGLKDRLASLL